MLARKLTLTAIVAVAAIAVAMGQAREGAQGRQGGASGRQGGGPPPAQLKIEMVKPGLYAILNPGANTLAVRVTNDGVILVDDMFQQNYDQIMMLIRSVTDQPLKYVISTHHHGDHTGGNLKMLTEAHATILAHKNARAAMVKANMPGLPPITYTQDAAVSIGGADVELHYVGRGHTEGDTIVYFPDLKTMATGDLFVVLDRVPVIDYANGGTSLEWPKTIDNILKYDFDTVVPGHGPVATRADLVKFREHMVTLQTRTRDLIKKRVPKDQYLAKLKTDDLGWGLGSETLFVRNSASGFYDELARAR